MFVVAAFMLLAAVTVLLLRPEQDRVDVGSAAGATPEGQ
jgi:hypothetical protein